MVRALSRSALLAATLIAGSMIAAACDEGDPASPVLSEDGGLVEAGSTGQSETPPGCGGEPTFAALRDSVFNKSCAFGACHGGANPAAGLDLASDKACELLVGHPSCVFSNRVRVVPGHPEQSYLYAKVSGEDLGTSPDGTCAGLTNGTPSRMPIGGEALCQGSIDQVKAWIAAGALCDSGDAGADGSADGADGQTDAGDGGRVTVTTLTSATATLAAGTDLTVTVTLNRAAPGSGADVTITSSDTSVLTTVGEVVLMKGDNSGTFSVHGVKAGSVTVKAQAPGQTPPATLVLTVN